MIKLILSVRDDVKVLGNELLARVPQLKGVLLPVDLFGDRAAAVAANSTVLRESLRWLEAGHLLVVFPAGEVSHVRGLRKGVSDPPWNPAVGGLVRRSKASVVPVYFDGANSATFQVLGLIHPVLRTMLLARELINKRNQPIRLALGKAIPHTRLRGFTNAREITDYLRHRTYMLKALLRPERLPEQACRVPQESIAPVLPAGRLQREVAAQPGDALLVEQENYCVYAARASQAPGLVQELGRLRELTFRAVGEGTGRARDIDLFDSYYLHLFVWDRADQRVVGAYRLGLSDELIKKYGVKALYTHSLFNYGKRLLAELPPAIELGRSFVVREYQRDFAPLLLLWRGIGAFVANNPKYRVLFGPVSISAEFKPVTRQLLVTYLRQHRFDRALARRVRPRQPFRGQGMRMRDFRPLLRSDDLDSIADVILQLEDERQDVPILLKHHLKLGGKALGFNVDGQFSDALDGLIMVDLNVADRRTLQRYMGAGACSVSSSTRRHNGNVLLPESIG